MNKYKEIIKLYPVHFSNENAPIKIITDGNNINAWLKSKNKQRGFYTEKIGVVYNDQYFLILRDLVVFPDGRKNGYLRVINQAELQGGYGVVILPLFNKKVIILSQFRHATRRWHYEIVRGFGESELTPEENAKKELEEEIGGVVGKLTSIGHLHNNTGLEGNNTHLFFAELSDVGTPNQNEGIKQFMALDIGEFEKMIEEDIITDGFTIAAYARAKLLNLI